MSDTGYVVWFVAMAVGILLILGLGTLRMAGLLKWSGRHQEAENAAAELPAEVEHHHHWFDRFHHAA